LNTDVQTDVAQINQLSAQAASLNQQITANQANGTDASSFKDQLSSVETQLAGLTNISITHTNDGDQISTGSGTPLVIGNLSFNLQTTTGAGGNQQVLDSNGTNITSSISGVIRRFPRSKRPWTPLRISSRPHSTRRRPADTTPTGNQGQPCSPCPRP
jgi:flagellar hook-associated protein 1 FlgK